MLEYFTLGACFIDPAQQEVKAARAQIRKTLGDDTAKAGWTYPNSVKALEILGEYAVNRVRGSLRSIKTHVNKDERTGNEYMKIRCEIADVEIINTYKHDGWRERPAKVQSVDGSIIFSLEASHEMAHRLVAKLAAVKPGERVTISPFAESVDRDGRTFVNHVLSVKTVADDQEVRGKDYFTEVRTKTRELEERLKGLGLDEKSIKDQVRRQKTKAFMEIADSLGANLPDIVPTRARNAEAGKPETGKPETGKPEAPVEAADEPIW